jgi:hypothetical protein
MYSLEKKNFQKEVSIKSLSPQDCFYIPDKFENKIYTIIDPNGIIYKNLDYVYTIELDTGKLVMFSEDLNVIKLTNVQIIVNG